MKKLILLLLIFCSGIIAAQSQPPQALKYKAIAKNECGLPLPNKTISVRFSIYQGSETGIPVYIETHQTTTNKFGLMDVNIGEGTPQLGNFPSIDWGASDYYIGIEIDKKGNNNFTISIGPYQLLSVPYALYAGNVQNSDDADADPSNELITSVAMSGTFLEIIEGGIISIVDLSGLQDGVEDADADPTNEIQDLQILSKVFCKPLI